MIKVIEALRLGSLNILKALEELELDLELSEEFDDLVFKGLERDDEELPLGLDELPPLIDYIIELLTPPHN
jgi:hypothetical protein